MAQATRRRAAATIVLLGLLGLIGLVDLRGQAMALGAIRTYQRAVAPLLARAGARCRFTPTCSRYAEAVIVRDGLLRGSVRAARRVARCGPWTRMGTVDIP